jgi:aminoglycoside 3-N-acetyltransferase
MELDRVVTRKRITQDLHALGVVPGDIVMSHESVRNVGWIVGGPEEVAHAILDAVGPSGTWMKYVCSEDNAYDLASWPPEVQQAYRESLPPFDRHKTRAHRNYGILTEYLRTMPGAVRSNHPDGSFAAIGAQAAMLMDKHPLRDGLGPGSPLERFLSAKGKILLLGSPLSDVTFLHYTEYLVDIPDKRRVRYETPMLDDQGNKVWVWIEELDSSNGIVPYEDGDYFENIVRAFRDAGLARRGNVGHADSLLIEAKALHAFALKWMETNLVTRG